MSKAILNLTDAHLVLTYQNASVSSIGQAYLKDEEIVFGDQAYQQAKLHPIQSEDNFWSRLDMTPLKQTNRQAQHQADLVYFQLLDLHKQTPETKSVGVALPDVYSNDQLSLLLGIVEHADFDVSAFISSAVAACYGKKRGNHLYIDMQQYNAVISLVNVDDNIKLVKSEVINGVGLMDWYNHWANLIAKYFIHQLYKSSLNYYRPIFIILLINIQTLGNIYAGSKL